VSKDFKEMDDLVWIEVENVEVVPIYPVCRTGRSPDIPD